MVLLALLLFLAAGAGAEEMQMRVFVSRGAMEESTAAQLVRLLGGAYAHAQWTLEMEGSESLRDLVLDDRAPQIAICHPGEALPWAREGLLIPLTGAITGQRQIQQQVLSCCVDAERLFIAPLAARQRCMAVNRKMMEEKQMGYLLREIEHPVWYVTQFHQLMDEFMIAGGTAFDVWPMQTETSAGIEALIQVLYGGALLADDGLTCMAGEPAVCAGVKWLRDMIRSGLVGYVGNREEALERFIGGKTPVFIDWTEETQKAYAAQIERSGLELIEMPYPSSTGDVVRVFEVTGAAAFADDDAALNDLAVKAIAFLHTDAQAQRVLGTRGIKRDDARWLADLSMRDRGVTLRALFAQAMHAVLEEGAEPGEALLMLQALMDAGQ